MQEKIVIIDAISDLHGFYPKLEGGDLLIVAGDLTANHTVTELFEFKFWLKEQNYKKKIVIGGNHDTFFSEMNAFVYDLFWEDITYLQDSGTEFEGYKIWGSPWSLWFQGINHRCKAFTRSEKDLKKKWELIPKDTDILITHSPPYGILDKRELHPLDDFGEDLHVGSKSLLNWMDWPNCYPRIHIFGHIHEAYGHEQDGETIWDDYNEPVGHIIKDFYNVSIMNENYEPVNKPTRIVLPCK